MGFREKEVRRRVWKVEVAREREPLEGREENRRVEFSSRYFVFKVMDR